MGEAMFVSGFGQSDAKRLERVLRSRRDIALNHLESLEPELDGDLL
jgi:hypothetical protein